MAKDMPIGGQEKPKKKEKGPYSPEDLAKKIELAEKEAASRPERLEKLTAKVNELFPGPEREELREAIVRSFDVPQWGATHNEGMLMDTHLEKIFDTLENIKRGDFPEEIPSEVRQLLQETAKKNSEQLERYVLLHDISKADVLRMNFLPKGEKDKPYIWEGNLELLAKEWSLPETGLKDPVALVRWFDKNKIAGVAYYNEGPPLFQTTKAAHGNAAVEKLKSLGYEDSEDMLAAIGSHEVAYQFSAIKPDTYEKHLGPMDTEARNFALVASFIDTMASLRDDGKPDLTNFLFLLASKENAETIAGVKAGLTDTEGLDPKKVETFLLELRKSNSRLPSKDAVLARLYKECKPTKYDVLKLKELLQELVNTGTLSAEEADEIENTVVTGNQSELGKKFGKKMKDIRAVMTASEKKD